MRRSLEPIRLVAVVGALVSVVACGSDDPSPTGTGNNNAPETIQFTAGSVKSLDSTGQVMVAANPGNPDIRYLLDSTFTVFTAGVQAKRIDLSTNLTTAPLYFVGIHRTFSSPGNSSSTWTLIALDDPSHLGSLIEVSGFAQNASSTAPSTVSGSIGTGFVNANLIQVATGGAVTMWHAGSGTVSFTSDAPGATCPGFTPQPRVTCAMETMHVTFNVSASSGTGGAGARQASVPTTVDVPAMRLTYSL